VIFNNTSDIQFFQTHVRKRKKKKLARCRINRSGPHQVQGGWIETGSTWKKGRCYGQTVRQTDIRTDRQTDTDIRTDRQTLEGIPPSRRPFTDGCRTPHHTAIVGIVRFVSVSGKGVGRDQGIYSILHCSYQYTTLQLYIHYSILRTIYNPPGNDIHTTSNTQQATHNTTVVSS